MIIEKAKLAQKSGPIRAILFHQGETDTADQAWPDKVKELIQDLRTDLNLGNEVPLLVGEVRRDGCCGSHNHLIHRLPKLIPNTHLISSKGLTGHDEAHFDRDSALRLGKRYLYKFLEVTYLPHD